MVTPPYQSLKVFLVEAASLSRDSFHIFLVFFVFLGFAALRKQSFANLRTLILPFAFAIALEVLDTYESIAYGFRVDWIDSIHDILVGMLIPVCLVIYGRFIQERKKENTPTGRPE